MKLHARVMIVQKAHCDLAKVVLDLVEKHDLTYLELIACLNNVMASWIKDAVRDERHPNNPNLRGGEADDEL